jgi:methyl-accepting chemotaxis protein
MVLFLPAANAAISESITLNSIDSPAFIIDHHADDRDPNTRRNGLKTTVSVSVTRAWFDSAINADYRVIYQLVDENLTPLEIANGPDLLTGASGIFSVSLSGLNLSFSEILTIYPDPATTLDGSQRYRVVASLQKRTNPRAGWIGIPSSEFSSSEKPVHHYTSAESGDRDWNVLATAQDLTWDRRHILQTDPDTGSFQASVNVAVGRYDDWDAPISPMREIDVVIDYDLIEASTGNEVPLQDNGQVTTTVSLRQFSSIADAAGRQKIPYFQFINNTADLTPVGQLDSSKSHILRCTVSHNENALDEIQVDTIHELDPAGLLHFNGNLIFGPTATQFDRLTAVPPFGPTGTDPNGVDFVLSVISITEGRGILPGTTEYIFGNEVNIGVLLMDNGDAIVFEGEEEVYGADAPGSPVTQEANNMTYTFGPVIMDSTGIVTDSISIDLPQGHIYLPDTTTASHHGESVINHAATIALSGAAGLSTTLEINLPENAAIVDESHPLVFPTTMLHVTPSGELQYTNIVNSEYIHESALRRLEDESAASLIEAFDETGRDLSGRASNDQYLRSIDGVTEDRVTITAADDASSRMSTAISLAAQAFQTHFPAQVDISWSAPSTFKISGGVIQEASSLEGANKLTFGYHQTCPDDPCSDGVPKAGNTLIPDNVNLAVTLTGGLYSSGTLTVEDYLAWGARGDGAGNIDPDYPYAHRTGKFANGNFFAPGYQIYAADNVLLKNNAYSAAGGDNAPGALLLSGFNGKTPEPRIHYPTEPAYVSGEGHYPGLNFVVDNDSENDGASRIGGNTVDYPYELMDGGASKYYSRCAGIFGRQVAIDGSFDPGLQIYGYDFKLTSFQLSFIASEQEDSWINGAITVEGHSDFTQSFLGLNLDCTGELKSAEIDPDDNSEKNLVYWNSTFIPRSIRFEQASDGACPQVNEGFLTMGVTTRVAHVPTDLHGTMAFKAGNGNLLTQTSGADIGVDSRFRLPASIAMDGPAQDYNLVPVGKLRFSNPEQNPDAVLGQPGGFVTFASTINVPYFRDLQVQVMTSANDTDSAPLYLAPGWTDTDGNTFFTNTGFDPDHVSWPEGDIDLSEYQLPNQDTTDEFLIKANQDLFGLVPLSYPLKWDDGARSFASMESVTDELVIIETEHQVDYLDASTTKVSFGIKYDGLPEINLSNMLNGQIDGAAQAVSDAISDPLKGALDEAFEEFDNYLADSLDALIDPVVDQAAKDILDPLYNNLSAVHAQARVDSKTWNQFRDDLDDQLAIDITALQAQLCKVSETVNNVDDETASLTNDLKEALEKIITGIDSIINQVEVGAEGAKFNPDPEAIAGAITSGILTKVDGEREIVKTLVKSLLVTLVEPEIAGLLTTLINEANPEINTKIEALLEDINPALDQISSALAQVREFLKEVYDELENQAGTLSGIAKDLKELVDEAKGAAGEFQTIAEKPASRAIEFLEDLARGNGIDIAAGTDQLNEYHDLFEEFEKDAFVAALKSELKDALISSSLMEQYQFLLRQTLYDLQAKFEQSVASVLSQVSTVMKELISDTIGVLEDEINPLLGQVNEFMGAAEVVGYAEFNGDSLRKVRIDNHMQIKAPDKMELNTFLEISCYTSADQNGNGGCVDEGERAVEVTIGATDVPFDWISDGLSASLNLKMSLKDQGSGMRPNGVGGGFELTGGTVDFQVFKITEFAVTMAIGGDECYFGGKASARFDSYAVSVGLFFGRTCSADPLLIVDEDVGSLLNTSGVLTGAYVYGEIWMPIVDFGCIFNISAGVGTGVGFFLDGSNSPVFVGKMYAGVSGEALCAVSIKGEVTMVGIVQDGSFSASGTGKLSGKAGWCPFCVKFSASATISYSDGDWDVDY